MVKDPKRCRAETHKGIRCKNNAEPGKDYCYLPSHAETPKLNKKQERFVLEYCIHHNATKAAIAAGYSKNNPSESGYALLQKNSVKQAINTRMKAFSMDADEAIKKLADWGRGSLAHFQRWDEEQGRYVLDLNTPEARENLHLIKEIREVPIIRKRRQRKKLSDGSYGYVEEEDVVGMHHEIKLHDAKDAIDKILRVHGAYSPEKFEDVTPQPRKLVMVVSEEDHRKSNKKKFGD